MAKTKIKRRKAAVAADLKSGQTFDGVYLLKMVLYLFLGSLWLKLSHLNHSGVVQIPIPIGLIVGLIFAAHEHFQIDRKIEYAVMVVAMLIGYLAPFGLFIQF